MEELIDKGQTGQTWPTVELKVGGFWGFLAKAYVWAVAVYLLSTKAANGPYWVVLATIFALSVPITLALAYSNSIRQIKKLHIFSSKGLLYRFLSRRFFRNILAYCFGILSSLFMLAQFQAFTYFEWIGFFSMPPIFYLTFKLILKVLSKELKPYLTIDTSLKWARLVSPIMLSCAYVLVFPSLSQVTYNSLEEAIQSQGSGSILSSESALLKELVEWMAEVNGIKIYALGKATGWERSWMILIVFGIAYAIYYNACLIMSCFMIPKKEFRRVFGRPTDDVIPPPLSSARVAVLTGVITLLTIAVVIPTFNYVELKLRKDSVSVTTREKVKSAAKSIELVLADDIDGALYRAGTKERVEAEVRVANLKIEHTIDRYNREIDLIFDEMERNVEDYLDWYYSLKAEATRVGKLLFGGLEEYIREQMMQRMKADLLLGRAGRELEGFILEREKIEKELAAKLESILSENRLSVGEANVKVVGTASLKQMMEEVRSPDLIGLKSRLGVGAGAGVAGGIIGTKLIKSMTIKITAKKLAQLGASALAKVLTPLLPASGLAAASFVAGGPITGFLGGAALSVCFEYAALKLEEKLSRENYRNEIVSVLKEMRQEVKVNRSGQ